MSESQILMLLPVDDSQIYDFLPLSPPGWRGIVVTVRAGGRAAGRAAAKLAEPISL